jgi:hypothetical protein
MSQLTFNLKNLLFPVKGTLCDDNNWKPRLRCCWCLLKEIHCQLYVVVSRAITKDLQCIFLNLRRFLWFENSKHYLREKCSDPCSRQYCIVYNILTYIYLTIRQVYIVSCHDSNIFLLVYVFFLSIRCLYLFEVFLLSQSSVLFSCVLPSIYARVLTVISEIQVRNFLSILVFEFPVCI